MVETLHDVSVIISREIDALSPRVTTLQPRSHWSRVGTEADAGKNLIPVFVMH